LSARETIQGHKYPIVSGIPVFLLSEKDQTIETATTSLKAAESKIDAPLYVETLGISAEQRREVERNWASGQTRIDPAISFLIGATSGSSYANSVGRLESYPIPNIPIRNGNGDRLLDIGSSWGRWSVSAARKGWRVIGIDPSLGALLAAQRAFSRLGLEMTFVCGDARFMPFKPASFRCVFSYSVIQHLSEPDAGIVVGEVARVLSRGGFAKIQMAHKGGLRSTYSRTRRDYLSGGSFRVRYWSLLSIRELFEDKIGPSVVMAEAFGGLGLLAEDRKYVSTKARVLITISTLVKRLSSFVRPLIQLADSVYVISRRE